MPDVVHTQRLHLQRWQTDDAARFHTIWGDPDVIWWGHATDVVRSQQVLDQLIARCDGMPWPFGWYAVFHNGDELVGSVMLQHAKITNGIEVGWHFTQTGQGKGFATEAASALLTAGFETLEVDRIVAPIEVSNDKSQRLAQRLGMHPEPETILYSGWPHNLWVITRAQFVTQQVNAEQDAHSPSR